MSLKIGNSDVVGIYLGEPEVVSVFLGEDEVYSSGDWVFTPLNSSYQKATANVVGYGVKKYSGAETIVTIPSEYKGLPVISIERDFDKKKVIEELTVPNTIQIIKAYAFCEHYYANDTNEVLTTITFENNSSLRVLQDHAFYYCNALASLTLPNSVQSIGANGISQNSALVSLTTGTGLTTLNSQAFSNNTALTSINLINSSSLTTLPIECMKGCTSLTTISLPSSLTTLNNNCFTDCSALNNISIPNNAVNWGTGCFSGCSSLNTVTLPSSGLTEIPESTFSGCGFTDLSFIPNSVTTLGSFAFSSNSHLTSLAMSNNVTTIGNRCFSWCTSLTTVTAADMPGVIGELNDWFYYCSSLQNLELPAGITILNLTYCESLSTLTWNNAITRIKTISKCRTLTSLTLPNTITTIDANAFQYMWYLRTLVLPSSLTEIPTSMCEYKRDWSGNYPNRGNYLSTLTIGSGVTTIGIDAFAGNPDISPLIIPNNVTTIKNNAFGGYTQATSSNINCNNFVMGSGITTCETDAFYQLVFNNLYYQGTIAQWCNIDYASATASPTYLNNMKRGHIYILDPNGTVTYNGNTYSKMSDIEIPNTITTIKPYTFYNNIDLKTLVIPASVTTINTNAFLGCTALKTITLDSTTYKDYFQDLYNMHIDGGETIKFRVHLDLADYLLLQGWDVARFEVIETVPLVGINYNNLPNTFTGEFINIEPEYEPLYANSEIVLLYTYDNTVAQEVILPELQILPGMSNQNLYVKAYRPTTVNGVNYSYIECDKTIKVTYLHKEYSVNPTVEGTWTATSGETVDGNQVYTSRYDVVGTDIAEITLSGYSHFEIYVKCYANYSYKKLYVYELDSTTDIKGTYAATSSYQKVEFDNISSGTHTIRIKFTSSKSYSGGDRVGKFYINEQGCY